MKVHKTSKLFYRKYPYKIELSVKGAEYIKRFGHSEIVEFCTGKTFPVYMRFRSFTDQQKQQLMAFSSVVSPLLKEGYQVRTEMNTINFYLEDRNTYESLVSKLDGFINSVTIPNSDDDLEKLFSKNHIIMRDRLPHKKYAYKVMLRSNIPESNRENFIKWVDTQRDAFFIPQKTELWLRGRRTWIYDPYMYVESSKHLTILGLYLGNSVRRTYEFVLRDTQINSVSEDEICQP